MDDTPKRGPLCPESFEKSRVPQVSCCCSSHLQPPSSSHPALYTVPAASPLGWGLGFLGCGIPTREKARRHEPWAPSSSTFLWKTPPRTPLSLRLRLPKPGLRAAEKCCRLVDVFRNYKCQSGASGRFIFTRPEGLSRTPARKELSPAGQRKELKRGRMWGKPISRSQFKFKAYCFFSCLVFLKSTYFQYCKSIQQGISLQQSQCASPNCLHIRSGGKAGHA